MKRLLSTLVVAALTVGAAIAQEKAVYTFCEGELSSGKHFQMEGARWNSAAMLIPAGVAKNYEGNELSTIRVGVYKKMNIDTIRVWVRHSLDGENLVEKSIGRNLEQAIEDGWNEVTLDEPLALGGDEPLYVGYDVKQRNTSYSISRIMCNAPNACIVNLGDGWQEERGAVSVEAVFTGNSIPEYDIMSYATLVNRCMTVGKKVPVQIHVRNIGTGTVNYFYVRCEGAKVRPDAINVSVDMERIFADANEKYVTVYLLEDDVPSVNQSGASSANYRHNHVVRAYNSTWGEPVEWDGMTASYNCTFALDASWKAQDMQVVAFVSEYGGDNSSGYEVDNTGFAYLVSTPVEPTAISSIAEEKAPTAIYDLQGRRMATASQLQYGIYVKDGKKVVVGH